MDGWVPYAIFFGLMALIQVGIWVTGRRLRRKHRGDHPNELLRSIMDRER